MMDELARALNVQRRALYAIKGEIMLVAARMDSAGQIKPGETLTKPLFTGEQIDRMLRIEIARDREGDWLQSLHAAGMLDHSKAYWEKEGHQTFQGVDMYIVNALPAPGWRIVNPMVKP